MTHIWIIVDVIITTQYDKMIILIINLSKLVKSSFLVNIYFLNFAIVK